MTLTAAQLDADAVLDDLIAITTDCGWTLERRGINPAWAYGTFTHPTRETVQAFYAVDPDEREDRFIIGTLAVSREQLRAHLAGTPEPPAAPDRHPPPPATSAVPPTANGSSAAHGVPPTVPPMAGGAAHGVPPMDSEPGAAHVHMDAVPPMEEEEGEGSAYTTDAVPPTRERNWSAVASMLTDEELLAEVTGSEIVWVNRLSHSRDAATVSKSVRYPPKITPANFDPERVGEDLRTLHFVELGSGFRSVAVARIVRIG